MKITNFFPKSSSSSSFLRVFFSLRTCVIRTIVAMKTKTIHNFNARIVDKNNDDGNGDKTFKLLHFFRTNLFIGG